MSWTGQLPQHVSLPEVHAARGASAEDKRPVMSRRAFLQRFTARVVGAAVLAQIPASIIKAGSPGNTIYFLSPKGPYVLNANLPPEPLWSDLKDG